MKKLKIEAGKFYRTRDGRKAGIYRTDANHSEYSIHGYVIESGGVEYSGCWCGDGRFFPTKDDRDDLIEEWQEPLDFDWNEKHTKENIPEHRKLIDEKVKDETK